MGRVDAGHRNKNLRGQQEDLLRQHDFHKHGGLHEVTACKLVLWFGGAAPTRPRRQTPQPNRNMATFWAASQLG
jgi:hypothetical protein